MKFVKGMIVGTLISAGVVMAYTDTMNGTKRKMIKNLTVVVIKLLVR